MTTVTGEKLVASGACLSRTEEGEIVFVDNLLPGEISDVLITKRGKASFADASVISNQSSIRVDPPCVYVAEGCGGCNWQHIDQDKQTELKREIIVDALQRIGKLEDADDLVQACISLNKERYRTTARVLVEKEKWGFRTRKTNDLIPIKDCLVMHQECVMQANDLTSMGLEQSEAQVRRHPDTLFEQRIRVSEDSFYQSHIDAPEILAGMAREVANDLGENLNCVDLYSGVGIFAVGLALDGHNIVSVESNASAVEDALVNLQDFDVDILEGNVDDFVYDENEYGECDLVIADPSRDGLGVNGLDALLSCNAKKIVLVSCDPAAGARDLKNIIEKGYVLESVVPLDMFGHTHHVEMFSILSLSSS